MPTPLNRRTFIKTSGAWGVGVALGSGAPLGNGSGPQLPVHGPATVQTPPPAATKRLLILGGTGFIGPPAVRYAVERGHEVTIFTRGRSEAVLPDVERLIGDRQGNLDALRGRTWDVVLDNNARDYRWVRLTTELLKDAVEHYLFVSSISAYAAEAIGYEHVDEPWTGPPLDVNSPLAPKPEDFQLGQEVPYGLSKAIAEELTEEAFPGRATIIRPGFIVGPGDQADRFPYWLARIHRGGEVLSPGDGTDQVQVIDVRDLMEFAVRMAEDGRSGTFNGVGPASRLSMAEMLYGIRAVTSVPVRFTWVPIPFLRQHEVTPFFDMPIWIPGSPISGVDNGRALQAGMTFRPLAVTALDTLRWHLTRPAEEQANLRIGIDAEREREVLVAWHGRHAQSRSAPTSVRVDHM